MKSHGAPRVALIVACAALTALTMAGCLERMPDRAVSEPNTAQDPAGGDPAEAPPADPPAVGGDVVDPSAIVGVWDASDGSGIKVIDGSGQCSGMYWNNGTPLDIGGPMFCALGDTQAADGSYTLVVRQPPNEATYRATFSGGSFSIESGGVTITLTRQ